MWFNTLRSFDNYLLKPNEQRAERFRKRFLNRYASQKKGGKN